MTGTCSGLTRYFLLERSFEMMQTLCADPPSAALAAAAKCMAVRASYRQSFGFRPFGRYSGWAGWPERFSLR